MPLATAHRPVQPRSLGTISEVPFMVLMLSSLGVIAESPPTNSASLCHARQPPRKSNIGAGTLTSTCKFLRFS